MRSVVLCALLGVLAGCASQDNRQRPPQSPSSAPPSYYYRYHYSKKLHRQVHEVIPSEELSPVGPDEQDRLARAASRMHEMRRGLADPPVLQR